LSDDELRDSLFEAAAASNPRLVKKLVARHLERVIALFPKWKVLPPTVRSEPSQTKWWAEGVIAVAFAAAALPRGFFTTITAVHTLNREEKGDLPRGLYVAYLMLEPMSDASERRVYLQRLLDEYPQYAPAWQQFADLAENNAERLKAIERGLAADPDPETKGMLLLNKALTLLSSGDGDGGVALVRTLVMDQESTLATEALAKAMLERVSVK
jgi:hypothetical protein